MDTPQTAGNFSDNFSKEKFEDPGIPQRKEVEIPGVHEANQKKAQEGSMRIDDWNKRVGELSEVIDSEGHRVRINHY